LLQTRLQSLGVFTTLLHEPRSIRDTILEYCKRVGDGVVTDDFISSLFLMDGDKNRTEEVSLPSKILIRDRDTSISQFAYHYKLGTTDEFICAMSEYINKINGLDLLIYMDLPVEIAIQRIKMRHENEGKAIDIYFEREEKLRRIHANYSTFIADKDIQKRCGLENLKIYMISANDSVSNIANKVWSFVTTELGNLPI